MHKLCTFETFTLGIVRNHLQTCARAFFGVFSGLLVHVCWNRGGSCDTRTSVVATGIYFFADLNLLVSVKNTSTQTRGIRVRSCVRENERGAKIRSSPVQREVSSSAFRVSGGFHVSAHVLMSLGTPPRTDNSVADGPDATRSGHTVGFDHLNDWREKSSLALKSTNDSSSP